MYAPTGRGEKWVMNSEGVVLEYSSEPFHKSDEIIAGINAHYGTSFYQEDDIDKDFTIGETMPNWNAYEKIELQRQKIAANIAGAAPNDAYMVGEIVGKSFTILAGENGGCNTKSDGLVIAYAGPTAQNPDAVIRVLGKYGIEIQSVYNEIVNYEIGSYIPNWSEYEIIG